MEGNLTHFIAIVTKIASLDAVLAVKCTVIIEVREEGHKGFWLQILPIASFRANIPETVCIKLQSWQFSLKKKKKKTK